MKEYHNRSGDGQPRMPFGKWRGHLLADLPGEYIDWLLTIDLREPLRTSVEDEYNQRLMDFADAPSEIGLRIDPDQVALARDVFDLGYRAAARKLHPDVGGSTEDMRRLNSLAESVRTQLRVLEAAGQ